MKPYIEQRLYTVTEQLVIVSPNETDNGLILSIGETTDGHITSRLYLTPDETIELSNMLKAMVDKVKTNSL